MKWSLTNHQTVFAEILRIHFQWSLTKYHLFWNNLWNMYIKHISTTSCTCLFTVHMQLCTQTYTVKKYKNNLTKIIFSLFNHWFVSVKWYHIIKKGVSYSFLCYKTTYTIQIQTLKLYQYIFNLTSVNIKHLLPSKTKFILETYPNSKPFW